MLLLIALLATAWPYQEARASTATGLILGRVVDGHSTQPVGGAIVTLAAPGTPPQKVITDAQGRFLFTNLSEGDLSLSATKSGYLSGRYGQRSPRGPSRPLSLGPGARIGDAIVRLWKPAGISGGVYDDAGEPAVGVEVRLLERVVADDGERVLSPGAAAVTTTDDRGVYRFAAVPPGEYVALARSPTDVAIRMLMSLAMSDQAAIAVVASRAMATGSRVENVIEVDAALGLYAPAFYAGAVSPTDARPIRVRAGEERRGVDFRVHAVPVARVAGTVIRPDGEPVGGTPVRLTLGDSDIDIATGSTTRDGQFVLMPVPAGTYVLRVGRDGGGSGTAGRGGTSASQPALWARQQVVAGTDEAASLTIALRRGPRIRGRIEFADHSQRPPPDQLGQLSIQVHSATPAPPGMAGSARIQPDGTFETIDLAPGKYRLGLMSISSARPWRAAAAIAGAIDLLDVPAHLETSDLDDVIVMVTSQPGGTIEGAIRTAQGEADAAAVVVVLPADPRRLGSARMRILVTTRTGAYRASNLPAGEYVVALTSDERLELGLDREELVRLIGGGTRVTLGNGERRTVDLRSGGL